MLKRLPCGNPFSEEQRNQTAINKQAYGKNAEPAKGARSRTDEKIEALLRRTIPFQGDAVIVETPILRAQYIGLAQQFVSIGRE